MWYVLCLLYFHNMHTHTHVCTQLHTYAHTYTYIHTLTHMHTHTYKHTHGMLPESVVSADKPVSGGLTPTPPPLSHTASALAVTPHIQQKALSSPTSKAVSLDLTRHFLSCTQTLSVSTGATMHRPHPRGLPGNAGKELHSLQSPSVNTPLAAANKPARWSQKLDLSRLY